MPEHHTHSPDSATPRSLISVFLTNSTNCPRSLAHLWDRIILRPASSGPGGFTLLDLIIVIIILGVLAMIIMPQIGAMANTSKANSAAWELVTALQFAQTLAIEYQRPFQFQIETVGKRNLFLVKDHTSSLNNNEHPDADPPLYTYQRVYNPMDKKPYIIDFDDVASGVSDEVSTREEYRGVTIDSVPGGGNSATIEFYPDGHSGITDSVVVLSLGRETRTVTVDGFTGKVTVE